MDNSFEVMLLNCRDLNVLDCALCNRNIKKTPQLEYFLCTALYMKERHMDLLSVVRTNNVLEEIGPTQIECAMTCR